MRPGALLLGSLIGRRSKRGTNPLSLSLSAPRSSFLFLFLLFFPPYLTRLSRCFALRKNASIYEFRRI